MHALACVARSNRANQDTIATYGGIKPLVELLNASRPDGGHNGPTVQANAALALTYVCRGHTANQTTAAEYGCLGQLGVMARGGGRGDGAVEAEAAGALWALSEGHDANKVPISPPRSPLISS